MVVGLGMLFLVGLLLHRVRTSVALQMLSFLSGPCAVRVASTADGGACRKLRRSDRR